MGRSSVAERAVDRGLGQLCEHARSACREMREAAELTSRFSTPFEDSLPSLACFKKSDYSRRVPRQSTARMRCNAMPHERSWTRLHGVLVCASVQKRHQDLRVPEPGSGHQRCPTLTSQLSPGEDGQALHAASVQKHLLTSANPPYNKHHLL